MNSVLFGERRVGQGAPCFVIAEVGVNHNGDPELARRMVEAVAASGADCVKFQTFRAEEFCNSPAETYTYRSQGREVTESMLGMFRRLELRHEEFRRLFAHARSLGLIPLSTPADPAAADLLEDLGADAFKIGSDDLVHTPFLRYVARKGKPMVISTGMASSDDVDRAVDAIRGEGNDRIVILHCVSLYPAPEDAVNLRRITTLKAMHDLPVGYSDHSVGITAALGAVALGACLLEKHFTLDRDLPGPDHWFSSDPAELAALVREVRRLESNLGSGRIWPSAAEREMAALARRSIVAARDLPAGHVLGEADFAYRRPGTGLKPYETGALAGRRLREAVGAGTILCPQHLAAEPEDGEDDHG